ncbi:MAG: NTP transferase domain-containing protein [Deltaproteobacteria bacterium]|nr:NTP transferase domain-containing protein [Deltaproteobacteria bacterium]
MTEPAAVTVLLLGGGQGRRAGGPKALKLHPKTGELLWRFQRRAILTDAAHVVTVLHPQAWAAPQPPLAHEAALAADPDAEPFDSLQRGLRACDPALPVAVLPVDCPWTGGALLAALVQALRAGPRNLLAVRPVVATPAGPRGGHPLLLAPGALPLLALEPQTARLDHWLRDQGPLVAATEVDDPAVLANFNRDGVAS